MNSKSDVVKIAAFSLKQNTCNLAEYITSFLGPATNKDFRVEESSFLQETVNPTPLKKFKVVIERIKYVKIDKLLNKYEPIYNPAVVIKTSGERHPDNKNYYLPGHNYDIYVDKDLNISNLIENIIDYRNRHNSSKYAYSITEKERYVLKNV